MSLFPLWPRLLRYSRRRICTIRCHCHPTSLWALMKPKGSKIMPQAYQAKQPQTTALYEVVELNLDHFLASHNDLPHYVRKELNAFLKCGIPTYGFARFKCSECSNVKSVPFSCKKRGFCPSCAGRRMSETSQNLLEKLPDVPYRQWVLTLPSSTSLAGKE